MRVERVDNRVEIHELVEFAENSSDLTDETRRLLDAIARVLRDCPRVRKVGIEAHTLAREADPLTLRGRRADAVRSYLMSRGVAKQRLVVSEPATADRHLASDVGFSILEQDVTTETVEIDPTTGARRVLTHSVKTEVGPEASSNTRTPATSGTGTAAGASATSSGSSSPEADHGVTEPAKDTRLQPPTTLGPELLAGGGFRLDGGPDGFADHTIGDFNYGLGLWAALDREKSFGLAYQRIGLGSARTVPTGSSVSAAYDLNVIWAALRLYPIRGEHTRVFVGLGAGVGWQNIQADGVHVTGEIVVAKPYVCSASSGPTFSIGPTAGLDIDVDRHFGFITELGAAAHAMSGGFIDGCAVGAGSAATIAGRVGLVYRFDADRIFGEQAGSRSTAALSR